jgi:hypothetical protein
MNEEKKINDDFEMIDFEEATDDNIETLDDPVLPPFICPSKVIPFLLL